MTFRAAVFRVLILCGWVPLLLYPTISHALSNQELYEGTVLLLYGGIGFFCALALAYFFGGFIVYLVRLGQEYRQVGLYHMLHGVRILFYVVCAAIVLRIIE